MRINLCIWALINKSCIGLACGESMANLLILVMKYVFPSNASLVHTHSIVTGKVFGYYFLDGS